MLLAGFVMILCIPGWAGSQRYFVATRHPMPQPPLPIAPPLHQIKEHNTNGYSPCLIIVLAWIQALINTGTSAFGHAQNSSSPSAAR
jgi:hypothetical protein